VKSYLRAEMTPGERKYYPPSGGEWCPSPRTLDSLPAALTRNQITLPSPVSTSLDPDMRKVFVHSSGFDSRNVVAPEAMRGAALLPC